MMAPTANGVLGCCGGYAEHFDYCGLGVREEAARRRDFMASWLGPVADVLPDDVLPTVPGQQPEGRAPTGRTKQGVNAAPEPGRGVSNPAGTAPVPAPARPGPTPLQRAKDLLRPNVERGAAWLDGVKPGWVG